MAMTLYMPPRETWAEPFWDGLSQDTLLLQWCERCNIVAYPPVTEHCAGCGSPTTWLEASGEAQLWSWTTFHREYFPGFSLPPPYTVLMVEVAERVRILASLAADVEPASLRCDASMQFQSREISPGVFVPAFGPRP